MVRDRNTRKSYSPVSSFGKSVPRMLPFLITYTLIDNDSFFGCSLCIISTHQINTNLTNYVELCKLPPNNKICL